MLEGTWLVTGTPITEPYPCRCSERRRCAGPATTDHRGYWCPCYGRTDVDHLPIHCCARRVRPS